LSLFKIHIDHIWAHGAATNCFPTSNIRWDNFGGSYKWMDGHVDNTRSIESNKVIGEVYGRLMADEPRIILSLYPTEVDIASAVITEHLVPAVKKLKMIELFVCLFVCLPWWQGQH
jgi:hypothetical protein